MKKLLLALSLLASSVFADTQTDRLDLILPTVGSPSWATKTNNNWQIIDSTVAGLGTTNVFTGTNTFNGITYIDDLRGRIATFSQRVTASSVAVTGLAPNQCVQTTTGGLLTTSGAQCGAGGGGGGSSLAVTQNQVIVTSPTTNLNFLSPPFIATLTGPATATISLDASSVTLQGNNLAATYLTNSSATVTYAPISGSNNYIRNSTSPQSASFYVSAGTATQLNASTATFSTGLIVGSGGTMINATGGKVGFFYPSPTQAFGIGSNMEILGAFMPGGSAGSSGQCLQSAGVGTPPVWGSCATSGGANGLVNASTFTYIPFYSVVGSSNVLSGSPGISVTTITASGLSTLATVTASSLSVSGQVDAFSVKFSTNVSMMRYLDGTHILSMPGVTSIYMGYSAGIADSTATSNTTFGRQTMGSLLGGPIGNLNTSMGSVTLGRLTSGFFNSAFGSGSMLGDVSGISGVGNSSFGSNSMVLISSGNDNSAFGRSAMQSGGVAGSQNSGFGAFALEWIGAGDNNSAFGYQAGNGTETISGTFATVFGSSNTFLGTHTGQSVSSNTIINNSIAIGNSATVEASNLAQIGGRVNTAHQVNVRASSFTVESFSDDVGEFVQVGTSGLLTSGPLGDITLASATVTSLIGSTITVTLLNFGNSFGINGWNGNVQSGNMTLGNSAGLAGGQITLWDSSDAGEFLLLGANVVSANSDLSITAAEGISQSSTTFIGTSSFPLGLSASTVTVSSTMTAQALVLTGQGNASFFNTPDSTWYQFVGSSITPSQGNLAVWGASNTVVDGGAVPGNTPPNGPTNSVQRNGGSSFLGSSSFTVVGSSVLINSDGTNNNPSKGVLDVESSGATGTPIISAYSTANGSEWFIPVGQPVRNVFGSRAGCIVMGGVGTETRLIDVCTTTTQYLDLWTAGDMVLQTATSGNGGRDIIARSRTVEQFRVSSSSGVIVSSSMTVTGAGGAKVNFGVDVGSITIRTGGSINQAVCWKTATTLGFCSSIIGAGGDCTCN